MKIFVCIESYLPGTLGGGPVRALANLIDHLHPEHAFFIFTRNHDYLVATEYADLEPNVWHPQSKASVYYSNRPQTERDMLEQIQTVQPDWIYLNGALPPLTRDFLRLRQKDATIQKIPTLLAPHGNLSKYALAHHRIRKQAWLLYAKWRKLYSGVTWHAASDREADQVRAAFGAAAQIRVVPMAPQREVGRLESGNVESKEPGTKNNGTGAQQAPLLDEEGWAAQRVGVVPDSTNNEQPTTHNPLHLVYFGRLSPEKNLPFAFLLLKQFAQAHPDQAVVYDLIGAGEPRYEAKLQELAASLPAAVQVNFIGQLSPEALQSRLHPQTPLLDEEGWPKGGVVLGSDQSSLLRLKATQDTAAISNQPSLPRAAPQPATLNQQPATSRYCAMLMPSLTENFSYTVLESFQAGIPVLISDQTPWRDLQSQGVGWDLSLENPDRWLQALEDLLPLSSAIDHVSNPRSDAIRQFASAWGEAYQSKISQLFVPTQT